MKTTGIILCLLCVVPSLSADVYPQAGVETYIGANNLMILTPWLGLRFPLSSHASFIFKYYSHNIRFDYLIDEGYEMKRNARLSNFTALLYAQKWNHDFYGALSYFVGTDSYQAWAFNPGTLIRFNDWLSLGTGVYLLNEKSILWYPDEKVRYIFLYSGHGELKIEVIKSLTFHTRINFYKNSENVTAHSYSVGLIWNLKPPVYLNVAFLKYSESAQYQFSGNYLTLGINFYY